MIICSGYSKLFKKLTYEETIAFCSSSDFSAKLSEDTKITERRVPSFINSTLSRISEISKYFWVVVLIFLFVKTFFVFAIRYKQLLTGINCLVLSQCQCHRPGTRRRCQ